MEHAQQPRLKYFFASTTIDLLQGRVHQYMHKVVLSLIMNLALDLTTNVISRRIRLACLTLLKIRNTIILGPDWQPLKVSIFLQ